MSLPSPVLTVSNALVTGRDATITPFHAVGAVSVLVCVADAPYCVSGKHEDGTKERNRIPVYLTTCFV